MNKIRINKFIAEQGICSRRKADEYILSGNVTVNGQPAQLGQEIDSETDEVKLNGTIVASKPLDLEYWAVYKPLGVVSTSSDEQGRPTVTDLVESNQRLYPVGRLDTNSEGLIVLTNDGELANELMHPSHMHLKSYRVIAKELKPQDLKRLQRVFKAGILIDNIPMKADIKNIVRSSTNKYLEIELDLITGYNRQIRRMCDKMGLEVRKLTRTGVGKLKLFDLNLSPGQSKKIQKTDII